jgi:hypothetical protein
MIGNRAMKNSLVNLSFSTPTPDSTYLMLRRRAVLKRLFTSTVRH